MLTRLQKKIWALDQKRRTLLDKLDELDVGKLEAKPLPDKWSIIEIVEHLVVVERDVFQNFPEPSQLLELKRTFKTYLTYPMVLFILSHDIPVKVPSSKMLPQGNVSLAELRLQWDENHQSIKSYVDSFDHTTLRKTFFKHPVTGPINLEQTVNLGQVHLNTHIRQIRKLQNLLKES